MKRALTYGLMTVGAVALLGALGFSTTPRLMAQIRAALVKSVDEPGRSPYQATVSCNTGNNTLCVAFTDPVPVNMRLVLTHVGAEFDIASGKQIIQAVITGATNGGAILTPRLMANNGIIQDIWTSNDVVLAYYEAGQTPTLQVAGGPAQNRAILSGYLVYLTK